MECYVVGETVLGVKAMMDIHKILNEQRAKKERAEKRFEFFMFILCLVCIYLIFGGPIGKLWP